MFGLWALLASHFLHVDNKQTSATGLAKKSIMSKDSDLLG